MLRIEDINVSYGKAPALRDVSLEVPEGELVCLLGSNGAGKSTLLKTISCVQPSQSGRMIFQGEDIQRLPSHAIVERGIVHVPEGRNVFPDLTVVENLRMGAFLRRDKEGVQRDMEFVYELFPRLAERRKQAAGTMSGGEAQMLAIARGLLSAPRLLMLDEPSLGLAPVVRTAIFKVVQHIFQEKQITILLVEQNAAWALQVATRAYILENGRITLSGTGKELADNPDVQKSYLGI